MLAPVSRGLRRGAALHLRRAGAPARRRRRRADGLRRVRRGPPGDPGHVQGAARAHLPGALRRAVFARPGPEGPRGRHAALPAGAPVRSAPRAQRPEPLRVVFRAPRPPGQCQLLVHRGPSGAPRGGGRREAGHQVPGDADRPRDARLPRADRAQPPVDRGAGVAGGRAEGSARAPRQRRRRAQAPGGDRRQARLRNRAGGGRRGRLRRRPRMA
mmetsp:Transcript_66939/g.188504  ORF Transcript_66939/g.188504 Transcript_66939/m.188504 type:complete len:214 (-) Transcript_66939:85-726(-)